MTTTIVYGVRMERLLITGGAGKVAALLRPRLKREGRVVRLLDIAEPTDLGEDEEFTRGSLTDPDVLAQAVRDVDAIIHMGGQSRESDARDVLESNIYGTYLLFEAARHAGVKRVLLASSSHAVGFHARGDEPLPGDVPVRPDTLYGWSKAAMEACARLYVDRYGMDVICLRIGMWFPTPPGLRGLAVWLSPDDGARMVEACLSAPSPGFRAIWGVSRNTRGWWSLAEGEKLGYFPRDDSERYAAEIIAKEGEPDYDNDPDLNRAGGPWCDIPLGEKY